MAIYKDSNKRYSIKFYLTLPNGEVKDVRIRNKDWTTKKRCQLVYDDIVAEKKKEILASYNITATSNFDNFANDFIKRFSLTRKKGTISQVELIIKNHIKPYINGKDSVADIFTSTYLISLENKIRDNLIKNNYSMRQYNRAVHVLGLMSEYALQLKLINSDNYSESKSVLVKAKEDKVVNEKLEWYTNEQMEQFFSVFDKGEYKRKVFFEVAYFHLLVVQPYGIVSFRDARGKEFLMPVPWVLCVHIMRGAEPLHLDFPRYFDCRREERGIHMLESSGDFFRG